MFLAALFTIARTWKQPRCPSADEWIKKLWCIYTGDYYSAIKKGINSPYDPTIPLLGVYPEKTTIQKDTFTPMFIAALFTTARTWKQ